MKTTSKRYLGLISLLCLITFGMPCAFAGTAELEQRVAALEKQLEEKPKAEGIIGQISERVTLSGLVELDYAYNDETNESDLAVGTIELGLEAQLHDYVTANVLLLGEDLDNDGSVVFDEVFFTFAKEGLPIYFVGGKRCQPFGTFESLFINDPITQDLYETNETGATVGFASDALMGLDLSFTLYKGNSLIEKVNEAGDPAEGGYGITFPTVDADKVNSYIINATISPAEGLSLAAFFNSEPGDDERNTTLGASAHCEIAGFIADVEYITALNRERDALGKEYNEAAWTASLGYQIMDPLLVAVRYEGFDSDNNSNDSLDTRFTLGGTYTLFSFDTFACSLMGEYSRTEYDLTAGSTQDSEADEFFGRLCLEF